MFAIICVVLYPIGPIGSMYAIYGNMDPSIYIYIYIYVFQYTPVMLAYIPAPWILWVYI